MAQTPALLEALKNELKARRKTYSDVARVLGLSTASVKRLFSEQSLSLTRLDLICDMLGIQITDLLHSLAEDNWQLTQLTEAQEAAIVDDPALLLLTVAVLNHLAFEDILKRFWVDEHTAIRKLAWLDREGIIDLLPGNRIKLKTASNFAWRPDGPIQRFFQRRLIGEYFGARFASSSEKLLVLNGMLSAERLRRFHRRMELLARDFEELTVEDRSAPMGERDGQTVVLAIRSWRFAFFDDYIAE